MATRHCSSNLSLTGLLRADNTPAVNLSHAVFHSRMKTQSLLQVCSSLVSLSLSPTDGTHGSRPARVFKVYGERNFIIIIIINEKI